MWTRPPQTSWRATAGQAQVCTHTLLQNPTARWQIINTHLRCFFKKNTHPPQKKWMRVLFLLSPGFYELSDGGSCSLSNSCTSVYSECLSSSQTSLLHPSSPANSQVNPPSRVDVCRRRSADESSSQPHPPRATGLHLGSSRIRANTAGTEHKRPRPVSTGNPILSTVIETTYTHFYNNKSSTFPICPLGDLDAVLAAGVVYFKPVDPRKPLLCPSLKTSKVDPKFQSNLVSRSGAEVYPYPSPLHAVALQSPIFSPGGDQTIPGLLEGQEPGTNSTAQMGCETMTQTYIDRLLVRSLNKVKSHNGPEDVQTHSGCQGNLAEVVTVVPEVPQRDKSVAQPHSVQTTSSAIDNSQKRFCMTYSRQERADNANLKQPMKAPEASFRYSYPAMSTDCAAEGATISSLRKKEKSKGEITCVVKSKSDIKCGEKPESYLEDRRGQKQKMAMGHRSSTEESQCFEVQAGHTGSPDFVRAEFVPAGSQRVKLRQADRKTKAVKLRRKSSEKSRAVRQQHGYSSGEKAREAISGTKGEQRRSGKGRVTHKFTACPAEEQKQGSGSESSHSSPGLMYTHKVHPKPHPVPAVTKSNKNHKLPSLDHAQALEPRKRRQGSSDVEMFQGSSFQHHRSKVPQAPGSMHMVRSVSAKPGQWMAAPRSFQTRVLSFRHNLNARYPPAPFHVSNHYPPRCESEYSAECASLFHSTIAESSEGEMSDNTTNRFGDSESSQSFLSFSDSDSSLSPDEDDQVDSQGEDRGLVWAEATLGPTAAGLRQLPRLEPSACRIKASRALKKKIRRFQPASLKVMTLV